MHTQKFSGSFQEFMNVFQRNHNGQGTALELAKMVAETFPSFRDEVVYKGRKGNITNTFM